MLTELLKEFPAAVAPAHLHYFHRRIAEKMADRSAASMKIVALGDSVTQGIGAVDEFYREDIYHRQLLRRLEETYPLCIFSLINAGADGESACLGLRRLERDVIAPQPDLVLIAFGLNESVTSGSAGCGEYTTCLQQMIERIRRFTSADVVLLTPNRMLTRDNPAVAPQHRALVQHFIHVQLSGLLEKYTDCVRQVGSEMGVPVADVYAAWQKLAERGVDTTAMLSNGLNHPDPAGHHLAAEVLWQTIHRRA